MVTVELYRYTGPTNVVNKTLSNPVQVQGVFRAEMNITRVDLTLQGLAGDVPPTAYNYAYIRELNRYYYIDTVDIRDSNTYVLSLSLDALKTYERQIMNATGTITETVDGDKYISVRANIRDVRPNVERIDFDADLFDATGTILFNSLFADSV